MIAESEFQNQIPFPDITEREVLKIAIFKHLSETQRLKGEKERGQGAGRVQGRCFPAREENERPRVRFHQKQRRP